MSNSHGSTYLLPHGEPFPSGPLPIFESAARKPYVSKITVGRLHNLGNYEHVRYEIEVQVPEGKSASQVLENIERTLDGLDPKPPVSVHDLLNARSMLAKPLEEWPEWQRGNEESYRSHIERDKAWRKLQTTARKALDDIGGTTVYTDAKDKWDDEL